MNWRERQMNITYCCAWIHRESFWQRQREPKDCTGRFGRSRDTGRLQWTPKNHMGGEDRPLLWAEVTRRLWGQRRSLLICGDSELELGRGSCTSYTTAPGFLILTPWCVHTDQTQGSPWAGINTLKTPANFLHDPAVLQGSLWDDRGWPMDIPFLLPMNHRQDHSLWFHHMP